MATVAFEPNVLRSYLCRTNQFRLDLSQASVLDIIDEHVKVKEKLHSKYAESRLSLKKYIRLLENEIGFTIMPAHITDLFYSQFIAFMQQKGLMLTSIKSVLVNLRTDLTWAARYSAPLSDTYDCIDVPKYHREQIALTMDEVSWIYHYDLTAHGLRKQLRETLERVRDLFCLSCNLGQRHSDMLRINKDCFSAAGQFSIVQQKTKSKAVVDIQRMSISPKMTYTILNKYDYKCPYTASLGNYNRHLHQLFMTMDWTKLINRSVVSGQLAFEQKVELYKCLSSHTARRTFATINYLVRKFPSVDVRRATGHQDDKSFVYYICSSSDDE